MGKSVTPFGKEIKKQLIEINMSQRELANELQINERYLSHIINGEKSGEKYIHKISEYLKIDVK